MRNTVNIKEIEALMQVFEKSSLTDLKIKDKDFSVELSRGGMTSPPAVMIPSAAEGIVPAAEESDVITAPMVGTFYIAANPESKPFVKVGDKVTADTTVCVLEAMKVFTEVPADIAGIITEVLVSDGDFVEFRQPLFKVKSR